MQDARLQVKLGAGLFVMHIWMMDVDKAVLKSSVRLATEPLTEGSNLIEFHIYAIAKCFISRSWVTFLLFLPKPSLSSCDV